MEKDLDGLKEGPMVKKHHDSLRDALKKHQIEKHQDMMAYMDTGLKIHFHPRQTDHRNE